MFELELYVKQDNIRFLGKYTGYLYIQCFAGDLSESVNLIDAVYYHPSSFTTATNLNIQNLPTNFKASFICKTRRVAWFEFGADANNQILCGVTGSSGTQMGMYVKQNGSYVASDYQNVLSANTDVEFIYSVENGVHTLSDGTHTISFNNSDITARNYSKVHLDSAMYLKELLIVSL